MGGFSAERKVSLSSGQDIVDALKQKGYDAFAHDLTDVWKFIEVLKTRSRMRFLTVYTATGAKTAKFRGFWICCKFLTPIRG